MSIEKIDSTLCIGCGICVESCPVDVVRLDIRTRKAEIRYPQECTLCAICEINCAQSAIYVGPRKDYPPPTHW